MPTKITTTCPYCGVRLSVASEKAGLRLNCPKCKGDVYVQLRDDPIEPSENVSNAPSSSLEASHDVQRHALREATEAAFDRSNTKRNPNDRRNTWRPAPTIPTLTSNHCPECNEALNVLNRDAASRIACPKCGIELNVPVLKPRSEFSELLSQLGDGVRYLFSKQFFGYPALILGLLGWFSSNEAGDERTIFCYPSILMAGIGAHHVFGKRIFKKWALPVSIAITLLLTFAWGNADTTTKRWSDGSVSYYDTYKRWSGQHVRRSFSRHSSPEIVYAFAYPELLFSGHGPMAGTGKPHGHWEFTTHLPHYQEETETVFYWYGEPVTEGEWHLRNDR